MDLNIQYSLLESLGGDIVYSKIDSINIFNAVIINFNIVIFKKLTILKLIMTVFCDRMKIS